MALWWNRKLTQHVTWLFDQICSSTKPNPCLWDLRQHVIWFCDCKKNL
jgi:hypothetical protein